MNNQSTMQRQVLIIPFGILTLFAFYLTTLYNYLLFHSIAEVFIIVVACGIFIVAWNSRRFLDNNYLLFIGVAYLFIAVLELMHTLGYSGMGIFKGYGTNLATQLWIAARYMESLSLLIAPLFFGRRIRLNLLFVAYASATCLIFLSIFLWDIFPACFVEGTGLTPFKKISEYIICLILSGSIALLYQKRKKFEKGVYRLLIASIVLSIAAELTFTFYIHAYGLSNLIGHYFKIVSFYLIYKAIIETGLVRPYDLLFRNLTKSLDKIRNERDRTQRYLDVAGVIIIVLNADQTVALINKKGCEVLGYEESEIIGKKWFDNFLPERDRDRTSAVFFELIAGRVDPVAYYENYVLTKDNKERLISWHNSILRNDRGEIIATLGSGEDITERRWAEEEREKLQEKLLRFRKMEAVGSLAGGIAHEFNNILAVIMGNTELAMNDVPESNPARGCLKEIQTASLRAKKVVRQLLGFARKSVFQLEPIHISPVIRESMILIRASIPATIEIREKISCESDMMMADSSQINLVLLNLCANAGNAMQEEGGVLEVSLQNVEFGIRNEELNLEPGHYAKLTIRDSGHGIDPKIIGRIFDPYFTTGSLAEASGMGLAAVHGIVKNHKGAITVASELGEGAVFEVLFPLIEDETMQEAGVTPEALPIGDEKILFVDDEESLVKMTKRMLERQGYQVETKRNPVEALDLIRSEPDRFDLVITDMTMPQMTGDKLVKEILNIRPDMPIILCSGFSEKIDAEKAKELGIRKYIEKPLDMSDFAVTVRKVLDK